MAQWPTRIVMPATAKRGDIVDIRTLVQHVMETGHRRDDMGKPIARDIIRLFTVSYAGGEIFRAEVQPGVAANPYFAFSTIATETGDVVFKWVDEAGGETTATRRLTVT